MRRGCSRRVNLADPNDDLFRKVGGEQGPRARDQEVEGDRGHLFLSHDRDRADQLARFGDPPRHFLEMFLQGLGMGPDPNQ